MKTDITEHPGIIDPELVGKFPSGFPFRNFFPYVANLVSLEQFLAVAGVLAPSFLERDEHIFLLENCRDFSGDPNDLTSPFGNDRKSVERWNNIKPMKELFTPEQRDPALDIDQLADEFMLVLKAFWSRRLAEVFPKREFEFEIGEDLLGEEGLCITFSQK